MSVTTNVTTLAGSFTQSGFTDQCAGNLARFSGANGVCVAQGAVFVADSGNQRIRQITFNPAPQPQAAGVRTNQFGFTITGTSGLVVVVEACTNPANAIWSPVGTNTLTAGSSYFSDPRWTNYTRRFYRLRSP
jgi:hypothetical protein